MGGFVGLSSSSSSTVSNSFTLGTLSGCTSNCGGFAGQNISGNFSNTYSISADSFVTGTLSSATDIYNIGHDVYTAGVGTNCDFINIWSGPSGSFPELQ